VGADGTQEKFSKGKLAQKETIRNTSPCLKKGEGGEWEGSKKKARSKKETDIHLIILIGGGGS